MARSQIVGNSGNTAEVASDGSQLMQLSGSNAIQPVDIQSRYAQTIQTHNAVSVATNSGGFGSGFFSSDGFDKLSVHVKNDASVNSIVTIDWSFDGVTPCGTETILAVGARTLRSGSTDVKAPYVRSYVYNSDTAAHTMSAWAYLKA